MNAETRENDQPEKTPKSSDAEMNAATQSVLEQFAGANVADILRSAFPPSLNSTPNNLIRPRVGRCAR